MSVFKPVIHKYTTKKNLTVNVFLVETENGVVVIDSATAISSSRDIRSIIDNEIKKPLLAILLTHGHPDHYTGAGEIIKGLDVSIYAAQGTIDFAKYQDKEKIATVQHNYGDDYPPVRVFPDKVVKDGDILTFDGVDFKINDLGPCESDSDSIWTIEIDGIKHVFIGDVIYNHMHIYFRDGHALIWMKKLDELLEKYNHNTVLYPAHGEICGIEIIEWHKGYMQAFLRVLKSVSAGKEKLSNEEKELITAKMQSYLPGDKLLFLMKYEFDETVKLLKENGAI